MMATEAVWRASVGEINLSSDKDGCMVEKTEWMLAPRGGAVRWEVRNDCDHPHEVEITFDEDPLEAHCVKRKLVPAGQMRPIPCNVRGSADEGHYPYRVHVDGYATDPELEVRGPLAPDDKEPEPRSAKVKERIPRTANQPWKTAIGAISLDVVAGRCETTATQWMLAPREGPAVWLIENNCPNARTIGIAFKADDPLDPGDKEKNVPGNGGTGRIKRKVKKAAQNGVYRYDVHGGDSVLDPELEVRGPLKAGEREPRPRPATVGTVKGPKPKS